MEREIEVVSGLAGIYDDREFVETGEWFVLEDGEVILGPVSRDRAEDHRLVLLDRERPE